MPAGGLKLAAYCDATRSQTRSLSSSASPGGGVGVSHALEVVVLAAIRDGLRAHSTRSFLSPHPLLYLCLRPRDAVEITLWLTFSFSRGQTSTCKPFHFANKQIARWFTLSPSRGQSSATGLRSSARRRSSRSSSLLVHSYEQTVGQWPLRFASRWLTRSTFCGQLEPRQRCSVAFRAAYLPFCYLTVALTAEVLRKGGAGQPFSLLHTRAAIASPSRTRPHARTSHMLGSPLGAVLTSLRCTVATSAMWPGVFRPRLGRGSTAAHPASPAITCPGLPVRIPH